jgi:signal transduction histidine kinase
MNLGADDYLTKPFKPDELLQMIRTRLELQAGRQREYTRQMEQLRWSVSHALPHELRTPLTHVISYVSLLLEDLDQLDHDAIRNSLLTIQQAGDRLYAVVEKYMLYLHIEILRSDTAQIRELRTARSESAGMLIRDIAEAQAKAYGRKSDLLLEITAPAALQIAEHDLVEIVRELVDNALKFSDAGTPIRVVGTLEDGMFNLYVVDQGWGMTLEQISQVSALLQFDRVIYEQKGVGLGLTIARGLAELYGGSLDIESEVQVGTQVMVCLSLAEPVLQSN